MLTILTFFNKKEREKIEIKLQNLPRRSYDFKTQSDRSTIFYIFSFSKNVGSFFYSFSFARSPLLTHFKGRQKGRKKNKNTKNGISTIAFT